MNSIKNNFKLINNLIFIRNYCYKPIKRVSLNDLPINVKVRTQENDLNISLESQLRARIKATGPITIAQYMKEILTNPNSGYYMNRDVFGSKGDFITSPEINQIFGELIGIWFINEWRKQGSCYPVQLVEFGPGRGTLIQDILRVFTHFEIGTNLSIHLIEISPYLAKIQGERLCYQTTEVERNKENNISYYRKGETLSGVKIYWYDKFEDVPKNYSLYLAHEFFDALPIHKFIKKNIEWKEILVDVDGENDKKFKMICGNEETPYLKLFKNSIIPKTNEHIEYSFEMQMIIEQLTNRLEYNGGICLIIDYGHCGEKCDTLRGFRGHKLHDPLIEPGTADITADVNFNHIKKLAEHDNKLLTYGPIEQGEFLQEMGGEFRLNILLENQKNEENIKNLKSGYDMLVNSNKMGSRFKFFSMFPYTTKEILEKYPPKGFF